MDVFALRNHLITDYSDYIQSFINIRDDRISQFVEEDPKAGAYWPDPLIQLNPNFKPGKWIDDLVAQNVPHPTAKRVFRLDKPNNPTCTPMRLHQHQSDGFKAAQSGENYVLTTGSGKSLSYIVPIVDHVLHWGERQRKPGGHCLSNECAG